MIHVSGKSFPGLEGQVALVTGASSGIGEATAIALAQEGAFVGILSRSLDKLERVAEKIYNFGGRCLPLQADVSKEEEVDTALKILRDEAGPITLLVNNAGLTRDQLLLGLKTQDWETVISVDLTGAYYVTRRVIRDMLKQKRGSIVNVSSVVAFTGNPGQTHYSAAKAGLIAFTKSLAREISSRNIRVNAVAPGFIETAMTEKLPDSAKTEYLKTIPLGRFGKPEEVASVILFLLSDLASYMTGTVLNVSGGLVMM